MTGKLTEYQRKIRHAGPFLGGQLPDYNFPKIKFCSAGHAIIGDNMCIAGTEIRCRTCARIRGRRHRKKGNLKEGVIRKVLLGLEEGKTINNLAGNVGDGYVRGTKIVDAARLNNFCDANPRLGKRIRALAEKNRISAHKKNGERARLAAAPALLRNNGVDAFEAIQCATGHLWEGERADVMSLMFVAVAEGRLKIADARARLGEFVKAHRYRPRVFGGSSLDVPIWIHSNTTLLDTLASGSAGLWD